MRTMLLLFKLKPEHERRLRERLPDWRIVTAGDGRAEEELYRNAEIVLGWNDGMNDALASAGKLRWIQTASAGVDKLPLGELRDRGIHVTSASGIHTVAMAETLFAMLLAFSRNLHLAVRSQSRREWRVAERYGQLAGRTMGIIGVGAIGKEVARLARAFGMRTLGVRRSGQPAEGIDEMYGMDRLDEVLERSDAVVNILPYTEETHHLYDADRFRRMKPDALFFNIGRGPSVDTDALVEALRSGAIGGAGLDVFEAEPLPAEHPLWTMDNVILTPHIGGWTGQYKTRVLELFEHNLDHYLQDGKPVRNVVDFDRSY
ncbi:D-2-hydroxyacid dehydrogenase [Paenibacillaceae bacterium WGS1546]|uniref:D-2-hydroxyacid dehydrogenase n=1 Tax=Cohnella sp. WGS1546 TaxID=3366810 RepID=UPI00372D145B